VYRKLILWREADLQVSVKQRKRRRLAEGSSRRRAEHKDHVWSYRFRDRPDGGRMEAEDDAGGGRALLGVLGCWK